MKNILTIVLSSLLLLPFTTNAKSITYSNSQNHYSFIVPDGWVEISKSTIDEATRQIVKRTSGQFVDYVTGFQLKGVPDFQNPYIIVQEQKINTPSYNQIIKEFESADLSQFVDKKLSEYSNLITNASIENPFIDKSRSIIFMGMETEIANGDKIKALSAMFLGKESITQINFYSDKSEYQKNLSTFNKIIDSFKYDNGYAYNADEAKKNDSPSVLEIVKKGFVWLITGLILALLYEKNKKKKEKKTGTEVASISSENSKEKNIAGDN